GINVIREGLKKEIREIIKEAKFDPEFPLSKRELASEIHNEFMNHIYDMHPDEFVTMIGSPDFAEQLARKIIRKENFVPLEERFNDLRKVMSENTILNL